MNRSRLLVALLISLVAGCGGGSDPSTIVGSGGSGSGSGSSGGGGSGVGGGGIGGGIGAFSFDVGVGGSGGIVGPLYAFGSIILNDLELNTDDADFYIEGESGGTQSDLHEGQQLIVAGDLDSLIAHEVFYRANLKGPVSSPPIIIDALLGRGDLRVLGQTVRVNAETRYDGTSLNTVTEGDLLEISGSVDDEGVIAATYVGARDSLSVYNATGTISGLTAGGFDLGGLLIDSTAADLVDIPDDMLANGQLVEVRIVPADFTAPSTAFATQIELLPQAQITESAELEVRGVISQFASITDFSVAGIPITTDSNTEYDHGDASMLGPDVEVEVEGVANAAGVIVAREIEVERNTSVRYEGTVAAVDAAANTLTSQLGLIFAVGSYTEIENETDSGGPLLLADLTPGDYVQILAFASGAQLTAVDIELDEPNTILNLRGRVTDIDEPGNTVAVIGVTVPEQDGVTRYFDRDDKEISRAEFFSQLATGASLQVRWDDFTSASLPADEFSLKKDED